MSKTANSTGSVPPGDQAALEAGNPGSRSADVGRPRLLRKRARNPRPCGPMVVRYQSVTDFWRAAEYGMYRAEASWN